MLFLFDEANVEGMYLSHCNVGYALLRIAQKFIIEMAALADENRSAVL